MGDLNEIKSIEELRKAQAAAQAQGVSITNYEQWEEILQDLDTAGVQSTGSFAGDVQLHSQVMQQIELMVEQAQEAQKQQATQPKNDESEKLNNKTVQDHEQVVKANVANGVSSDILANYMKYYHLF
ncbi:hypothetical protein HDR58_01435 [bacterium]|nr:hypothetical protein [bacterium]